MLSPDPPPSEWSCGQQANPMIEHTEQLLNDVACRSRRQHSLAEKYTVSQSADRHMYTCMHMLNLTVTLFWIIILLGQSSWGMLPCCCYWEELMGGFWWCEGLGERKSYQLSHSEEKALPPPALFLLVLFPLTDHVQNWQYLWIHLLQRMHH